MRTDAEKENGDMASLVMKTSPSHHLCRHLASYVKAKKSYLVACSEQLAFVSHDQTLVQLSWMVKYYGEHTQAFKLQNIHLQMCLCLQVLEPPTSNVFAPSSYRTSTFSLCLQVAEPPPSNVLCFLVAEPPLSNVFVNSSCRTPTFKCVCVFKLQNPHFQMCYAFMLQNVHLQMCLIFVNGRRLFICPSYLINLIESYRWLLDSDLVLEEVS